MESTLGDMFDPHWWTTGRMFTGLLVALLIAYGIKTVIFDND